MISSDRAQSHIGVDEGAPTEGAEEATAMLTERPMILMPLITLFFTRLRSVTFREFTGMRMNVCGLLSVVRGSFCSEAFDWVC